MATSFGALCTDFYINQKLALKMDLPGERETLLHFFDRIRKSYPQINRFRRFENELALESSRREAEYRWLALRRNSMRSGIVNPPTMDQAHRFHHDLLELAPSFLSLSALDIDHLEVLFGFDLECPADHDRIIYQALIEPSPMAEILKLPDAKCLDVQPAFGLSLTPDGSTQAYFEVKTRPRSRRGSAKRYEGEPISLFVTLRRYGPFDNVTDLPALYDQLAQQAEQLATERLVPHMLTPIARHITSESA